MTVTAGVRWPAAQQQALFARYGGGFTVRSRRRGHRGLPRFGGGRARAE
jgi:hypothetical protein